MRASRLKVVVLGGAVALTALHPRRASAQVLVNMQLNQGVGADNDFFPHGNSFFTSVTDTAIPFQTTVSANDATGAFVTASYSISDNGSAATISINASGSATANGNFFGESTNSDSGSDTLFNLLQTSAYTATVTSTGPTNSEFEIMEGSHRQFEIGTGASLLTDTVSGVMPAGPLSFFDGWATNSFNDAPQPANESGTFSLTLTFTAIPEPSSALLIGGPAVALLARRRCRSAVSPRQRGGQP